MRSLGPGAGVFISFAFGSVSTATAQGASGVYAKLRVASASAPFVIVFPASIMFKRSIVRAMSSAADIVVLVNAAARNGVGDLVARL